MAPKSKDGPGVGEYAFWLIFFALGAMAVAALITQFAIKAVTGTTVSFWNALLIDLIASTVIWIFVSLLKGTRK